VLAGCRVSVPNQAEHPKLSLAVQLGYHNTVKMGQWMPVDIDVINRGRDFRGLLDLALEHGNQPNGTLGLLAGRAQSADPVYEIPLTVAGGTIKHVRTYVVANIHGVALSVRVMRSGPVVASHAVAAGTTANLLVGVLSDESSAFDGFGALQLPSNLRPQVVHVRRDEVATSGVLLRAFDLIAIDDFATDGLSAAQQAALADYVTAGGALLVGSGPSWHKTLAGLAPMLLPFQISGTATLSPGADLLGAGALEVATGSLRGGYVWLYQGNTPLLVEKPLGNGSVTLATFDWAKEPIASWSGTRELFRQIAIRTFFANKPPGIPFSGGPGPFFGGPAGSSVTERGDLLMSALTDFPGLDLPPVQLIGLLALLYVVLVGPVNYLVLGAIRRRELGWVTAPAIALIFACIAYSLAQAKGGTLLINQISIIHLAPGSDRAYEEAYTGILTRISGDYSATMSNELAAITPVGTEYRGTGVIQGGVRVLPKKGEVDLDRSSAFTLWAFGEEASVLAPKLIASVDLSQGKLVGRVHNASSVYFTDTVVLAGDAYQKLGSLRPGADAVIDVALKPVGTFPDSPSSLFDIYPTDLFGLGGPPPDSPLTPTDREANQRTQILQLLVPFKGLAVQVQPMLVAWTNSPLEPMRISGPASRVQSENAVVLPLPIGYLNAGPLPAGFVPARLVTASGQVELGPGGIYIQGGGATFEFTPPLAPGVRLAAASLGAANPYGPRFEGPIPLGLNGHQFGLFVSHVWDWSQSSWIPIDLNGNAQARVPEAAIAPTGTIRLRVQSAGGDGFQLGTPSLAATLQ